jgi:hypothetical protein
MNRIELKKKLDELEIPTEWYSLYGERNSDTYVLEWSFKWEIFFFERGRIDKIASLDSEEDACHYFYDMMVKNKAIEDKIKNMEYVNPIKKEERRIFIVSDTGDTNIEKEE